MASDKSHKTMSIYNDRYYCTTQFSVCMPTSRTVSIDWEKYGSKIASLSDKSVIPDLKTFKKTKNSLKNTDNTQNKELDLFWKMVYKTRCVDKDEGYMCQSSFPLNKEESSFSKYILNNKMFTHLKEVLDTTAIREVITTDNEYNDIMTHIIFKGQSFYNGIIADPTIALYLCDQYYPIYTWILIKAQ